MSKLRDWSIQFLAASVFGGIEGYFLRLLRLEILTIFLLKIHDFYGIQSVDNGQSQAELKHKKIHQFKAPTFLL